MAQTKLLEWHRRELRALMYRVVDCPAEQKAEEQAYQRAAPLIRKMIEKRYPLADMEVLKKYEVLRTDDCVNIQLTAGGVEQFKFKTDEKVGVPRTGSCSTWVFLADDKITDAMQKWTAARDAAKTALAKKQSDYVSFIETATTFEQIVGIWPEASELAPKIARNLPVALNDDVIAQITADSKRRLRSVEKIAA